MTKKQMGMISNFMAAKFRTIYDAYGKPSANKVKAFERCVDMAKRLGSDDYVIPSRNCHMFTFAFSYLLDGEKWLHYETNCNSYDFRME